MLPISAQSLQWLLLMWMVILCCLLLYTWTSRRRGIGLPLSYFCLTSIIHVPGAFAYSMPNYRLESAYLIQSGSSLYATLLGFEVTILGLIGFVMGSFCVIENTDSQTIVTVSSSEKSDVSKTTSLNYGLLISVPILFLLVATPVISSIASMTSLGVVFVMVSVVIVSLACYDAWRAGDRRRFLLWFVGSIFGFPIVTLSVMGFISYGVLKSISVAMFVVTFYRPRWVVIIGSGLLCYIGVSLYIIYMQERAQIRESVWGGYGYVDRLKSITPIITDFTFFNPTINSHLEYLDYRLNQNTLVGNCVDFMTRGGENFTGTSTWWVAATAWIPRMLWPEKPVVAGSYGMVSRFTGMKFSEGTSVGLGHIMEFYTFYGRWSVFVGMFLLGLILRWFDANAARCLQRGDYVNFGGAFLIGAAMIDVGSNIPTMVANMAASFVFVRLVIMILRSYAPKFVISTQQPSSLAGASHLLRPKTNRPQR